MPSTIDSTGITVRSLSTEVSQLSRSIYLFLDMKTHGSIRNGGEGLLQEATEKGAYYTALVKKPKDCP